MSGDERLVGDFRIERGHVQTSLEQLTKNLDGMKVGCGKKDRLECVVRACEGMFGKKCEKKRENKCFCRV